MMAMFDFFGTENFVEILNEVLRGRARIIEHDF